MNWQCGCGHVNGPNLAVCAACNRTPAEGGAINFPDTDIRIATAREILRGLRTRVGWRRPQQDQSFCSCCGAMRVDDYAKGTWTAEPCSNNCPWVLLEATLRA